MHIRKAVSLFPILAFQLLQAAPVRYKDPVFTTVTATSNIKYGSAINHSGATENLLLDVYQPSGDTAKARALIIFIHGGGFSGGAKTDGDIVFLCQTFAKKGYVTASFAYRLETPLSTAQAMGTEVVRAVQDAKAAVRFLRAHRAEYGIDDTRIMMGGTSAGGALSLDYAYIDADEMPAYIDTNAIGGIEGRSGTPGVSSAINGIINCWGGVGDSTILKNGKLPIISFHGTADPTVPYDIGYALGNPALVTFGSACVHRVLTRAGVHSVLKPFPGMGHGFPSLTDARVDTMLTMTTAFAYDLLFGAGASIRPSLQPAGDPARAAAFLPGIFFRTAEGGRFAPTRAGVVRGLDGRAVSPLSAASGMLLVRPASP
ncbi:MAG: hypothetical protein JWO30_4990 [Fibrobacteres bacterium]|nr:hypothetical protein [Fibrobacterota bacterium]